MIIYNFRIGWLHLLSLPVLTSRVHSLYAAACMAYVCLFTLFVYTDVSCSNHSYAWSSYSFFTCFRLLISWLLNSVLRFWKKHSNKNMNCIFVIVILLHGLQTLYLHAWINSIKSTLSSYFCGQLLNCICCNHTLLEHDTNEEQKW